MINVVALESESLSIRECNEAKKYLLSSVQLYEIRQYNKSNDQLNKTLKFVKRSSTIRIFCKLLRTMNMLRVNKYEKGMVRLHKLFISCQSSNLNFHEIFALCKENRSKKSSLTHLELEKETQFDQQGDKASANIQLYLSVKLTWALTGYILSKLLMSSNNSNIAKHYI